jgi:hypothetical protein
MTFIVDTNVAVVANGGDWLDKAPECVIACSRHIMNVKESGRIALDDRWSIVEEYRRNLRVSGEPGLGDAFLKWVLTNIMNPERCDLVTAAPFPDHPHLAAFDPADRKFVSVAMAHNQRPPILQATDSKWRNFAVSLAEMGVDVLFLCG